MPDAIEVQATGFVTAVEPINPAAPPASDHPIVLAPAGALVVTVLDASGAPIDDAGVAPDPVTPIPHGFFIEHTGNDGTCTFDTVPPGSWRVRARRTANDPWVAGPTVEVRGRETARATVTLAP